MRALMAGAASGRRAGGRRRAAGLAAALLAGAAGLWLAAPAVAAPSGAPTAGLEPPGFDLGTVGIPGPPVRPFDPSGATAIGTLTTRHPVLDFRGSVFNPTPLPAVNDPSPEVCAAECEEYAFSYEAGTVPFLVGIKGTVTGPGGTFDADQGFDLYVYGPSGRLLASSNGVGSNGQAVAVTPLGAGTYTAVVTFTYAYDAGAGWLGEVRLMAPPSWKPAPATCGIVVSGVRGCYELPRLRALPAYDLTASGLPPLPSTPVGFPFPLSVPTPTSCYADETLGLDNPSPTAAAHPVLRCLRFTTDIENVGAGPLSVGIPLVADGRKGDLEVGYLPGDCQAVQFVASSKGPYIERPAGGCQFHLEHAHFHYDGLIGYALYSLGPDGSIGSEVSKSTKESFCLTDDDYFGFGTPGPNGPRVNVGQPDCNLPRQLAAPSGQPSSGTFVKEGITPGWGDVYTWDTPDQFIDVTHVPSGTYWLVEKTNPLGSILVSGPAQTCAATELHLYHGPDNDTVRQLAAVPSVPCPA